MMLPTTADLALSKPWGVTINCPDGQIILLAGLNTDAAWHEPWFWYCLVPRRGTRFQIAHGQMATLEEARAAAWRAGIDLEAAGVTTTLASKFPGWNLEEGIV